MQERKLVTALFCDLVGSTALGERLDPEVLQNVQAAYFERMRGVVERSGGTLEKFIGDAVVAVFGVPLVREDDAQRAVQCALAMRGALDGLNDSLRPRFGVELESRIGVASGEALVDVTHDALATGDVMNIAARLEQAAQGGEILVSNETMRLTRAGTEYGPVRRIDAHGKQAPVEAWPALREVQTKRQARAPLVGREAELEVLAAALDAAIRTQELHVIVVLGEPGIGKSRLADEFAARAAGHARVFRGESLPYGEETSWRALAQVLRAECGIDPSDSPEAARAKLRGTLALRHEPDEAAAVDAQLAPLLGASSSAVGSASERLWALRRYLEKLALSGPTVIVLDDVHWAGETLLELVHEIVETIAAVPLVLVCQGRTEARELLVGVMASDRSRALDVGPLSPEEARSLAGSVKLDEALVERAEGNPLFVEELAAMAAEERTASAIPQSLRALIAARLDLLPPDAKRVAQAAAVVGGTFWDVLVASALRNGVQASALRLLRTRGLVDEDDATAFPGSRQFRFHHALIREVAYESVSKRERAQLHADVAEWLDDRAPERPGFRVLVAHHLDRAVSLSRDVAAAEPPELVEAAVSAQWRAGDWAETNAASSERLRLARRAVALSAGSGDLYAVSRARLARALATAGSKEEAAALAEEVLVREDGEVARAHAAIALALIARDRVDVNSIRRHAEDALALARERGVHEIEVIALQLLAAADMAESRHAAGEARLAQLAEMCAARDDPLGAGLAASYAGNHALYRGALDRAETWATEALSQAGASVSLRAQAQNVGLLSQIRREQGRFEEAVELGRERLRLELELGETMTAIGAQILGIALPLILLGRYDAAWEALAEAREMSERAAVTWFDDDIPELRAGILRVRGRLEEADDELAGLEPSQELARLRAAQGRQPEAEAIWRSLIERETSDNLLEAASLKVGLAGLLVERGREEEASELAAEVRAAIAGKDLGRLERELAKVEALYATAS